MAGISVNPSEEAPIDDIELNLPYRIISSLARKMSSPWDGKTGVPHGSSPLSHRNIREGHLSDIIPSHLVISEFMGGKEYSFSIGDSELEEKYPHYHILEDARLIRKPGKGTSKSLGSQSSVKPSERDYGRKEYITNEYGEILFGKNGKPREKQEYRSKNYRGSRGSEIKNTSTFFTNRYYHWIESTFDKSAYEIGAEIGAEVTKGSDSEDDILILL